LLTLTPTAGTRCGVTVSTVTMTPLCKIISQSHLFAKSSQ
jgi:hypothetical protein